MVDTPVQCAQGGRRSRDDVCRGVQSVRCGSADSRRSDDVRATPAHS